MDGFPKIVRLIALVAVLAVSHRLAAANGGERIDDDPLESATYKSPSGTYTLTVIPSDVYGRKGGSCRLTWNGKEEVWAKRLPFPFWKAAVTDTGVVAGYAYTQGQARLGNLIVSILDRPEIFGVSK
jgi:hypothetical protein